MNQPRPADLVRPKLKMLIKLAAAVLVLIAAVFGVAWRTTGHSYWSRIIVWQDADFDDWRRFPSRQVPNDPVNVRRLRTAPAATGPWPEPVRIAGKDVRLEDVLASSGTAAFLVARGDEIVYERYLNGYAADSTLTSFSVAKSVVSALVGRAIADGQIGSVDDPITAYLPELDGRGLEDVTIAHLLEIASGIRYDGEGSGGTPWQDDARTYYDPELRALALGVQRGGPPGGTWQYNNYHPQLLGLILERTTGMTVSDTSRVSSGGRSGWRRPAPGVSTVPRTASRRWRAG
jgi:CubicO group peptidase (beta-lactamase class C family)